MSNSLLKDPNSSVCLQGVNDFWIWVPNGLGESVLSPAYSQPVLQLRHFTEELAGHLFSCMYMAMHHQSAFILMPAIKTGYLSGQPGPARQDD